jgi:hypothetical protein
MKFQIPSKFLFTHFMERSEHKMWIGNSVLTNLTSQLPSDRSLRSLALVILWIPYLDAVLVWLYIV